MGHRVATTRVGLLTSASGGPGRAGWAGTPPAARHRSPGGIAHVLRTGEVATACGAPVRDLHVLDLAWDPADLVQPCPACALALVRVN